MPLPVAVSQKLSKTDIAVSVHELVSEDLPMGTRIVRTQPIILEGDCNIGILSGFDAELRDIQQSCFKWEEGATKFCFKTSGVDHPSSHAATALMDAQAWEGAPHMLELSGGDEHADLVYVLRQLQCRGMVACLADELNYSAWRLTMLGLQNIDICRVWFSPKLVFEPRVLPLIDCTTYELVRHLEGLGWEMRQRAGRREVDP